MASLEPRRNRGKRQVTSTEEKEQDDQFYGSYFGQGGNEPLEDEEEDDENFSSYTRSECEEQVNLVPENENQNQNEQNNKIDNNIQQEKYMKQEKNSKKREKGNDCHVTIRPNINQEEDNLALKQLVSSDSNNAPKVNQQVQIMQAVQNLNKEEGKPKIIHLQQENELVQELKQQQEQQNQKQQLQNKQQILQFQQQQIQQQIQNEQVKMQKNFQEVGTNQNQKVAEVQKSQQQIQQLREQQYQIHQQQFQNSQYQIMLEKQQKQREWQKSIALMNDNLRKYPYLRGIHFQKSIYEFKRYQFSYIKWSDGQTYQHNPPEINRELYQAPEKIENDITDFDKPDYLLKLFEIEDQKWQIDNDYQQMKQALKKVNLLLKEANEDNFQESKHFHYINQMNLFGTYNILIASSFSNVKNLRTKIQERMKQFQNIKQEKIVQWKHLDKLFYQPSLDQEFYNQKMNLISQLRIQQQISEENIDDDQKQKLLEEVFTVKQYLPIHYYVAQDFVNRKQKQKLSQEEDQRISQQFIQNNQLLLNKLSKQYEQIQKEQNKQQQQNSIKLKLPTLIYQFTHKFALSMSTNILLKFITNDYPMEQQRKSIIDILEDLVKNFLGQNYILEDFQFKTRIKQDNLKNVCQSIKNIIDQFPELKPQFLKQKIQNLESENNSQNKQQQQENNRHQNNSFTNLTFDSDFIQQDDQIYHYISEKLDINLEDINYKNENYEKIKTDNKFINRQQFFPNLKTGKYQFGSSIKFLIYTYVYLLYERISCIYDTIESDSKLQQQKINIAEFKRINHYTLEEDQLLSDQQISVSEMVNEILVHCAFKRINELQYEEITKAFGPNIRGIFMELKFILTSFKKCINNYLEDRSEDNINMTIQIENENEQILKKLDDSLKKNYINSKNILYRFIFDQNIGLFFAHQINTEEFKYKEIIELDDTESEEVQEIQDSESNEKIIVSQNYPQNNDTNTKNLRSKNNDNNSNINNVMVISDSEDNKEIQKQTEKQQNNQNYYNQDDSDDSEDLSYNENEQSNEDDEGEDYDNDEDDEEEDFSQESEENSVQTSQGDKYSYDEKQENQMNNIRENLQNQNYQVQKESNQEKLEQNLPQQIQENLQFNQIQQQVVLEDEEEDDLFADSGKKQTSQFNCAAGQTGFNNQKDSFVVNIDNNNNDSLDSFIEDDQNQNIYNANQKQSQRDKENDYQMQNQNNGLDIIQKKIKLN
ncbi:hypothetical protein PPERSA_05796 [Pseudocohnilembus persalinus]|uniref:Uncharacterized protein n=1 Tax=Pseudocohnilembus persalinus TaxID=266149 RepID=A0A0V0R0N8_PSEPJ|nr:hypothetical protein PPERSA_05796 [Pseudocohnilembus persalinus]|eukprot:KRX07733.1 hypothetical protein PPERSA_05796 [Pseudocohnilembus persalinus]